MSNTQNRTDRLANSHRLTPIEITILAAVLLVAASLVVNAIPEVNAADMQSRSIRVERSDTLWTLAQAHPMEGRSTLQTVEMIRELNKMESSELRAGELILVPDVSSEMALAQR